MTIVSRTKLSLHFRSRAAGQGAAAHYSQVPCTLRSPANCPSLEIARALQQTIVYYLNTKNWDTYAISKIETHICNFLKENLHMYIVMLYKDNAHALLP